MINRVVDAGRNAIEHGYFGENGLETGREEN